MAQVENQKSEKLAELEFQLRLLEDGVKSPFWQLLVSQWTPLVNSATGDALRHEVRDRDFLSGKANGLHYFLNYPAKQIKKLQIDIKILRNGLEKT